MGDFPAEHDLIEYFGVPPEPPPDGRGPEGFCSFQVGATGSTLTVSFDAIERWVGVAIDGPTAVDLTVSDVARVRLREDQLLVDQSSEAGSAVLRIARDPFAISMRSDPAALFGPLG